MPTMLRRQHGFAIVSAIFLLIILSLLGGFMLNFSTTQHATSMTDVEGSRAYWAARSGLNWGYFQALDPTASAAYPCSSTCNTATACSAPVAVSPAAANVVMGSFTVTVACTCTPTCQEGTPIRVYRFVVNACNRPTAGSCPSTATANTGSVGYAERQMTGMISISN